MTGEMWQSQGVPPPRNGQAPWYDTLTIEELWKEVSAPQNNNLVLVTLKRPGLHRGFFNGLVLLSQTEVSTFNQRLLEIRGVSQLEGQSRAESMPVMPDGRRYPAVVLKVAGIESLTQIRKLPFVESIEPLFVAQDGAGCSLPLYKANPADTEFFGNIVPWLFHHLGVVDAWNLYKVHAGIRSPGYPARIGVVDTGVYQDEHQLTTVFHWSSLRLPARHHTVVSEAWDDCGHGTRVAGLATAPLDIQNVYPKKILGVAWGAELTTVKYNSGVVALGGSRVALVNAINMAVNDGARIVNLALGMPYWSVFVYDNIVSLYNTTETIFIAAAGTHVTSVVFPAAMPHVLAVSIVKSKDSSSPDAGYERYGGIAPESAYGTEVDFSGVNGDGDIPTTGGSQLVTTIAGSSSGTAQLSGIVALVWGKQPSASRSDVVNRLRKSSSLKRISGEENVLPGTSMYVGYGIPDAYLAAGGSRRASISGPSTVIPGTSYTLTARIDGWLPHKYLWNTGETGASVSFTAGQSGATNHHSVTITNPTDGRTLTAHHSVTAASSHKRILYADPPIVRYPQSPLAGGTYDIKVNYGAVMPVGCSVIAVLGQKVDYVDGAYKNNGPPLPTLYLAWIHGFTIIRPGGISARNLDVDARVWHSGTNAVRVKIHYAISEPDGVDCNVPPLTVHGWYPA
jgi:hypothetical protein